MIKYKTYKLSDLCDLVAGFAFKSKDFGNYPNKVVKIADIQPPTVNINDLAGIDLSAYNPSKLQKFIVSKGDYVLAMTGATIGKLGRITNDIESYINQRVLTFRPDETIVDKDYLYYQLCSDIFSKYILNHIDSETAQPNISAGSVGGFEISLPPLPEQRRIAGILGAIDDKIENNRRINTNLELQAQALYKQWFVDFEFPNEEGKPYKSSGGKMVDSELGPIPEDWSVKRLDDYTVIKRGGSPRPIQNYLSNTGLNWLKISDATSTNSPFILEIKEFIKEEGLSKTVFLKKGNLVLSNSATPCIPKFLGLDTCIHDGWLYFPNAKLSKEYLYLLFKNNRQEILSQGNGSVFLNLKTDILKSHLICLPNCIEKMNCFNMIVKAIFKNIENCSFEIKRLATLRDTLLPKLMNGEIKTE